MTKGKDGAKNEEKWTKRKERTRRNERGEMNGANRKRRVRNMKRRWLRREDDENPFKTHKPICWPDTGKKLITGSEFDQLTCINHSLTFSSDLRTHSHTTKCYTFAAQKLKSFPARRRRENLAKRRWKRLTFTFDERMEGELKKKGELKD